MKRSDIDSQQFNTKFIYLFLLVGFAFLLGLIWHLGSFSVTKFDELVLAADELSKGYTNRMILAMDIRAETESVISEARLFRSTRDNMRVSGPPFKMKLNEAAVRLDKLLDEGEKLHRNLNSVLPAEERQAWQRVVQGADEFWRILAAERGRAAERDNKEQTPNGVATTSPTQPSPTPIPQDEVKQKRLDFYEGHTALSQAARDLANILVKNQASALETLKVRQARAAAQVNARRWWAFLLGLLVAIVTYLLIQRQVRQIREARNEAQEAEGLTTSVLNSLSNDVLAFNELGAVVTVNPAFLKDFSLSHEECLQQDYRTLLSQRPRLRNFVESAAGSRNGAPARRERFELVPPEEESEVRLFDVDVAPRYVGPEQRGHVVVLTDVTEAEHNREEANRNRTLSAMGKLTAQITHDIFNPLGAVKLNVDLLEMQVPEDGDLRHTITRLKRSLGHLSNVVEGLRYLTRPREPERQVTELNGLLNEVVEMAGHRLERARVCVTRNYAPAPLLGDFDPAQLRQVFLNLLVNAIEASPRESTVELRTRYVPLAAEPHDKAIEVSVIDHGVGMSPETKRHIAKGFYTTKQNGTGLGMMITREIVQKHQGQLEIESEEGKGTLVKVVLPL